MKRENVYNKLRKKPNFLVSKKSRFLIIHIKLGQSTSLSTTFNMKYLND